MNWEIYLTLLRPVRSLLIGGASLSVLWIFQFFVGQFESKTQAHTFAWWVCTVPLVVGFIITEAVHMPLHHPFALLIPDILQRLARWHGTVVGVLTLIFTGTALVADHTLPPLAISGLCAALLTLTLPKNRDQTGAFIGLGLIIILSAATYNPDLLRRGVLAHPWIIAAGTWSLAYACFKFRFSCGQLRRSALTPYTSLITDSATPDYVARQKKAAILDKTKSVSPWTAKPVNGLVWVWIKAALYERSGQSVAGFYLPAARTTFLVIVLVCLISIQVGHGLAHSVYTNVWPENQNSIPGSLFVVLLITFTNRRPWILRPTAGYPASRTRLGRQAYLAANIDVVVFFGTLLGGALVIATIIAIHMGWPTPILPAAKQFLRMLWIIPFLPIAQWSSMQKHVFRNTQMSAWLMVQALIPVIIGIVVIQYSAGALFPAWGATHCFLWIAVSQYGFYTAIIRWYREGDFI